GRAASTRAPTCASAPAAASRPPPISAPTAACPSAAVRRRPPRTRSTGGSRPLTPDSRALYDGAPSDHGQRGDRPTATGGRRRTTRARGAGGALAAALA